MHWLQCHLHFSLNIGCRRKRKLILKKIDRKRNIVEESDWMWYPKSKRDGWSKRTYNNITEERKDDDDGGWWLKKFEKKGDWKMFNKGKIVKFLMKNVDRVYVRDKWKVLRQCNIIEAIHKNFLNQNLLKK